MKFSVLLVSLLALGATAAPQRGRGRGGRGGLRRPTRPNPTRPNPVRPDPPRPRPTRPAAPPANAPNTGSGSAPSGNPIRKPSGSVTRGGETRPNPEVENGRLQTTPVTSRLDNFELAINGISTAIEIANLGITIAQLQQNADLRSCIANMPACCQERELGNTDDNFCFEPGVGAGLRTGQACPDPATEPLEVDYVDTGARACAVAFPLGSAA
ncbi:hypothetical protein B0I35DRAFT_437893 [Stachybotrys elegans]|uniref:Hydrophobin n=1 Tax=Stachybotrys elegans TaxID=80388 RepID=A0A8K0WMY5_9HYPO|nr:hypothetical protein B0I35DRAFT_437893 [Stachybotrys elegans]